MTPIRDLSTFSTVRGKGMAKLQPFGPRIAVGMGTCGAGNGAEAVFHAFADTIDKRGLDIQLARVGCFGFCAQEPLVNVRLPGRPLVLLHRVQTNYVDEILDTVMMGNIPTDMALCKIEDWDHITAQIKYGTGYGSIPSWQEVPFFKGQKKIVLRNCGLINPDDVEEYVAVGGYDALLMCSSRIAPTWSSSRSRRPSYGDAVAPDFRPARNGISCGRRWRKRSTSSATLMKVTRALT